VRPAVDMVRIADPYSGNPLCDSQYYTLPVQRLINAIHLGSMTYDANLLKDGSIKNAFAFGGSEAIREGRIPQIMGFNYKMCGLNTVNDFVAAQQKEETQLNLFCRFIIFPILIETSTSFK
jgi:hypothetical protein